MTLKIDLPKGLEARLEEEAARHGQDASGYVAELVRRQLVRSELEALKNRKPPQSLDELKPRIPSPPGTNGLAQIVGKWPGDETDEEIYKALEELS